MWWALSVPFIKALSGRLDDNDNDEYVPRGGNDDDDNGENESDGPVSEEEDLTGMKEKPLRNVLAKEVSHATCM